MLWKEFLLGEKVLGAENQLSKELVKPAWSFHGSEPS